MDVQTDLLPCSGAGCRTPIRRQANFIPQRLLLLIKILLPALLLLFLPAALQAQFNFRTNNGAIMITGYTGYGGTLSIPGTINGLPVTSISTNAFALHSSLTEIAIPSGITNTGNRAFFGCFNLSAFAVDALNCAYSSVDGVLFDKDQTTLIQCPGRKTASYVVPNSVIILGDGAFYECSSLTAVLMNNALIKIGDQAFAYCYSMTNLAIPDSVTSIGDSAFYGCYGVTNITIGSGLNNLASNAFDYCESLQTITVNSSNPFYSSVDGVLFDKGQTTLVRCPWPRSGAYSVPDGVLSIGDYAFYGCALTSVIVPDTVTNIGDWAFAGCPLTNISISGNVGAHALDSCFHLTNATFSGSVSSIGDYAFAGCSSLTSLTIPESVTNIGDQAFQQCDGLATIAVDALNPSYSSADGVLFNKSQTTLFRCIETKAGNYTVPNTVTNIGNHAFDSCYRLTGITLPDSVTTVESNAFNNCGALTNVTIGKGVTSIGGDAFVYCLAAIDVNPLNPSYLSADGILFDKDQTIVIHCPAQKGGNYAIPDGVTRIEDYAFRVCYGLTNITIPNTVTNIGNNSFDGCSHLGNITIPNGVTHIGSYAFCDSGINSVTIPSSVLSIGEWSFFGCSALRTVTMLSGITSIGDHVFAECTSLSSVIIPNSVTNIGDSAFFDSALTSLNIPNSVTSIEGLAFEGCTRLEDLMIPNGVISIGDFAFYGCVSLTNVAIGQSVTSLGYDPIGACIRLRGITVDPLNSAYTSADGVLFDKGLTTLIRYPESRAGSYIVPSTVTTIAEYAFNFCGGLTSITMPDGLTSILFNAFGGCTNLTSVYFQGNAPLLGGSFVFGNQNTVVYYLPGTTGWGATFAGLPTKLWNPQAQTSNANFDVRNNQFGFNITGTVDIPVVVVASPNLANPVWSSLQTMTLTNGLVYFSDAKWTNYPGRFYRIRSP